jgi:hypothetical protein
MPFTVSVRIFSSDVRTTRTSHAKNESRFVHTQRGVDIPEEKTDVCFRDFVIHPGAEQRGKNEWILGNKKDEKVRDEKALSQSRWT